jgi:hypothetical protein
VACKTDRLSAPFSQCNFYMPLKDLVCKDVLWEIDGFSITLLLSALFEPMS